MSETTGEPKVVVTVETTAEPGIWYCDKCGEKNYFPISPDIMILDNKLYIWTPSKRQYVIKDIKCSKCGALYYKYSF